MKPRRQARPALKTGLIYVNRSDGFFVGRREQGLLFTDPLPALVIPLLTGRYSSDEIALLVDRPASAIEEIIGDLERSHLIDRCAPAATGNANWPELQLITHRPDIRDGGQQTLIDRGRARIDIHGCGLVGANLARVLAASGIGELRLVDQRRISTQHLPITSLANVGTNAAQDLASSLSRDYPKVLSTKIQEPTLVIVTRLPSPSEILTWMNFSIAHLLIDSRGDSIEIGPLVLPGRSSCLRCLTLDRLDRDPNWHTVTLCGESVQEPPTALALVAAGISALAALSLVDAPGSGSQSLVDTTMRVDGSLKISATSRRRHPRCGCAWNQPIN